MKTDFGLGKAVKPETGEWVRMTDPMMRSGATGTGGWTKASTEALGVEWEGCNLPAGWLAQVVGLWFPAVAYEDFLAGKGVKAKGKKDQAKVSASKASIGISLNRLTIERAGSLARKGGLSLSEWLESAAWMAINRAEDEAEVRPRGTR